MPSPASNAYELRTAAAAIALAALVATTAPRAATPIMPVSEIRTGMIGIGRTVFEGTELKEFKVHILGVLKNVQGPRRDLILARLEGGPLAQTGVAQGMSGSPVYIDGRLIGAVSYSIGAFSKEPIAGITPIAEMKDATAMPRVRSTAPGAHRAAGHAREPRRRADRRPTPGWRRSPRARRTCRRSGIPAAAGAQIGAMMRPISTPLLMGGFEPDIVDLVRRRVPRRRLHADGHRRGIGATVEAPHRPAARRRRDRRVADRRRSRDGRHRHGHPHRRRPRLRVRPSVLQSRAGRVPDDARLRLHDAPEPDDVVQDLVDGRDDRDDAAGSRDGDCRHARQGPGAGADDRHAWCRTAPAAPRR